MAKEIIIDYQKKKLRATISEQQIWFSFSDIQEIIKVGAIHLHPEEMAEINVDGCLLQMINEFGVYRLASVVSTDQSNNFRKWLIGDAILRLRKYGCYKLSIAEEKEKMINEISELSKRDLDVNKLKHCSLEKLKLEKLSIEKAIEREKKEKEINQKRMAAENKFPYSQSDLEADYDIGWAIKDLSWNKENLDEYMVRIGDNECRFNEKFVQHLKNGNYKW